MILTKDILKVDEWETRYRREKAPFTFQRGSCVKIDISHLIKYRSDIHSDMALDNIEATGKICEKLLNHEFKEEDVLIQRHEIGKDYNGYDIYFRINYIPYLKAWAKTLGEAHLIKDWMVKAK